ncbi:TfoX/Sxy family protein [Planctomycetales bacterium ZRK34]|nr:TfoX/Sxy family protein [Planctomycetales bacterium ZRK34]
MAANSEFVEYVVDALTGFDFVEPRRMFGGYGLFCDEVMFAIVVDDVLYVRVDAVTDGDFDDEVSPRFSYMRAGRPCKLPYRQIPDAAMDNREALCRYAELGREAAIRKAK